MNLLLLAFTSLQLATLPNISSWQKPGLDINGPFHYQLNPTVPVVSDISYHNKYYTCKRYGLKQVCIFTHNLQPSYSIFWRQYPVYIKA